MIGRLFQIIYILMDKECVTAKELADRLEVSVRTINRDIDKLSEANIPIYTTRGRSGGISLLSDFVLNKKLLSEDEKNSILSAIKVMGTVSYEDEKQALTRLEDFFGQSACNWIEIEFDGWNEGLFDKEKFTLLKDAILKHKKVEIAYSSRIGNTKRVIRPYQLIFRAYTWYLYAFCEMRQEFRYFKLKRISSISVLEELFVAEKMPVEKQKNTENENVFEAVLEIDKTMAYRVYDDFPVDSISTKNDKIILTVKNAHSSWIYEYILSFGEYAKVIFPDFLKATMEEKIRKMCSNYF